MNEFFNLINAICVEDLGFPVNNFPSVQFVPTLKESVLEDILDPKYTAAEPKGFFPRVVYKNISVGRGMLGNRKYAAEIYYMGKLKYNSKYLNSTRKRLRKLQMGITKDELDRLFLGFYTNPQEFGNRPLSKFRYDLAVDEGVI